MKEIFSFYSFTYMNSTLAFKYSMCGSYMIQEMIFRESWSYNNLSNIYFTIMDLAKLIAFNIHT